MKKTIRGSNITLTDAISDYTEKRLDAIRKYIKEAQLESVHLDIDLGKTTHHHRSGDIFRAEVNVKIGQNHYRAEATTSDLYAAIDEVRDEIVAELRARKSKTYSLVRKGRRAIKELLRRA